MTYLFGREAAEYRQNLCAYSIYIFLASLLSHVYEKKPVPANVLIPTRATPNNSSFYANMSFKKNDRIKNDILTCGK